MAYKYDPTIEPNIKRLIGTLTSFEENTEIFDYINEYFLRTLEQSDTTFCITKNEIDEKIDCLADKFVFHGFLHEANAVKTIYAKYVGTNPTDEEIHKKMAVMKFLFALSKSPTTHLASLPEGYKSQVVQESEVQIDWGAYLQEGIELWNPNFDDSDDLSDVSDDFYGDTLLGNNLTTTVESSTLVAKDKTETNPKSESSLDFNQSFNECRENLQKHVQHSWFNADLTREMPTVDHPEANIALKWEKYLSDVSHGLLGGPHTNILSEYKVVREILWQMHSPHNSIVFAWRSNELVVNNNVTIASLRPFVFKNLVETFLPDIRMLHELRSFNRRVIGDDKSPHTYRGYAESLMSIVRVGMHQLIALELDIQKQETTMTIIGLSNRVRHILGDIQYLSHIHAAVILDYNVHPADHCCVYLLAMLYQELYMVYEKRQMDICLTLYIDSVYKYVRIIEEWFRNDQLFDAHHEFPIKLFQEDEDFPARCNTKKEAFERANYVLRSAMEKKYASIDPLMALLQKEVVQIGREIRLLSLLGKLHLLHETNFSIYDEWKEIVIRGIREYFAICERLKDGVASTSSSNQETTAAAHDIVHTRDADATPMFRYPAICTDYCKYPTEMDRLENIVDVTDGFLMEAFAEFLQVDADASHVPRPSIKPSTYECLTHITTNNFPGVQHVISDAYVSLLSNKYQHCGEILKNVFKHDYNLREHFELMGKIFLFKDDFIFPFYRRVFHKIETNAIWGNDIWLTFDLQDVLMDVHAKYYENVSVTVKKGWQDLLEDPLKTCTLINVQYKIVWPIDIIITERSEKMYKEMFYFILKIKWALYTLNQLQYSRIEKLRRQKAPKNVKVLLQRLDVLRFGFVNIFSAVQHYVLGYVFRMCSDKFEADFNIAKDLDMLIESHFAFVHCFHRLAARVRDYQATSYGFDMALYLVRQLRKMWMNPGCICDKELKKTEEGLKECHRHIFEVISIQVYD